MKQFNFRKLVPHLIAIAVFLLVAVIFCKPSLESDTVLRQGDITSWHGMSHQSFEYKEKHGHFPLWSTSMFSGMPAYQIALEGAWSPLSIIDKAIQLWLPQPINFFFLACICFYFLCICLCIRPYAAILGALAFAYCSFSPIIITAGHNTQMLALAYAPAVIGAVVLIFDKKYLTGFALTALLTTLQIGQGHQQVTYYLFLVLLAMTISYAIRLIRTQQTAHLLKSVGAMLVAGLIGVAANALVLMTTYDYSKESKRGGQLIMDEKGNSKDALKNGKTVGLTKDYAFMWSYGKAETWSLMFPGVMGYGSHFAERNGEQNVFPSLNENSNVSKYLVEKLNVPEDQASGFAMQQSSALYWGDQPFTSGPVYLGAITCFLFLLGMFILNGKHKWWVLSIGVLGILMSWGEHLPGFNYFLFDHFPLYNKFRVPTMALVIPQLVFPIVSALALNRLMDKEAVPWKKFVLTLTTTLAAFILVGLFYISADFSKENKQRTVQFNKIYSEGGADMEDKLGELNSKYKPSSDNQLYEGLVFNFKGDPDAQKKAREFVSALKKDRASLLLSDILRSFLFVLIAAALVAIYLKQKINALFLVIGLTLALAVDQLGFGMKYLNDKSFASKSEFESNEFPVSNADRKILEDKDPNFRVFNTASLEESRTSYYHKSIGGYHPAKIGIYDDLMQYQLFNSPNVSVINMLNTKYVIRQQGNETMALPNPGALGNAWFVKGVKFVNGPVEEMKALDTFNPSDTAIVDQSFKAAVTAYTPADSSASIKMTTFDNDAITYKSISSSPHVAVFSEIYYKDWKAYIDGKPADYFKTNYVLRGMVIPAGNHNIEFKFEPAVYYTGRNISNISTWIMMLLLLGALVVEWKRGKTEMVGS
jgi:hypothetical protein